MIPNESSSLPIRDTAILWIALAFMGSSIWTYFMFEGWGEEVFPSPRK